MATPGSKVVETIRGLKAEMEAATDAIVADASKEAARTKDGFHKVKSAVIDPWAQANTELEDFVNQITNGGPPLDK